MRKGKRAFDGRRFRPRGFQALDGAGSSQLLVVRLIGAVDAGHVLEGEALRLGQADVLR